jgi:Fe-S cluster assembly iron-binding protein IscA
MLTLSPAAAELLTETRTRQGIPDDASLRIGVAPADDGDEPGVTLGFVDQPMDGDVTGESQGMSLAVAREVAPALDDAAIDVQQDGDAARLVIVPGS